MWVALLPIQHNQNLLIFISSLSPMLLFLLWLPRSHFMLIEGGTLSSFFVFTISCRRGIFLFFAKYIFFHGLLLWNCSGLKTHLLGRGSSFSSYLLYLRIAFNTFLSNAAVDAPEVVSLGLEDQLGAPPGTLFLSAFGYSGPWVVFSLRPLLLQSWLCLCVSPASLLLPSSFGEGSIDLQ